MKKFATLFVALFALCTAVRADNDRPIDRSQLPEAARTFLDRYFADGELLFAKMESDFMRKSYEVLFADGTQIEFDGSGNWEEIDCKRSAVPSEVVPAPILEHVRSSYPDASIVKIERDRREYEVKLSNRIELTFDKRFRLIDMDM